MTVSTSSCSWLAAPECLVVLVYAKGVYQNPAKVCFPEESGRRLVRIRHVLGLLYVKGDTARVGGPMEQLYFLVVLHNRRFVFTLASELSTMTTVDYCCILLRFAGGGRWSRFGMRAPAPIVG